MACELTLPPSGPPKIRPSSIPKNIESTSSPICSACVRNPAACTSKAERSPGLPTACSSVQQLLFRFRKQTHREGAGLAEAGRDVVELRAVRVAGGHVALDVVEQVSRVPVVPPPVQWRAVLYMCSFLRTTKEDAKGAAALTWVWSSSHMRQP